MEQDNNSPWQYKPDEGETRPNNTADNRPPAERPQPSKDISWEASEFIDHQHGTGWYLVLALITIALAGFLVLSRDFIAAGIVVVLGIVVAIFASRKPAIARYEITESGLRVNGKIYRYGDYKSFAIFREGALSSINLFPLKRFMPPVSAYFEAADEPKITAVLGNYLPYEERKMDSVERLSRRLRL